MPFDSLSNHDLDRLIRIHRQRLATCVRGRGAWKLTSLVLAACEELKRQRLGVIRVEGYVTASGTIRQVR